MTDFRNLTQPHDLRSQLGLIPGRRAEELSSQIEAALRVEAKPLNPADATPDPLHRAMGCSSKAQDLAVNKLFSSPHLSGQVISVTINPNDPVSKDASEIVASIRKMIDSPEVQSLRQLGEARKYAEDRERIEAGLRDIGLVYPSTSASFYDVRKLSGTEVTIDGQPLQEYLDQLEPGFHCVEADKVRGKQVFLDGVCVGGMILRQRNQPTHRALSKIHDHVESLESDILEALVMAGANPHADRRRLESARTQFELAFMMMKRAVDPEQERQ